VTIDEFVDQIDDKLPPAPPDQLAAFEAQLGQRLPDGYRRFLVACNGGWLGDRFLEFEGLGPDNGDVGAMLWHIGGLRPETHYSLVWNRECYRGRIPDSLIWIMDDPSGNAICLGVAGGRRGRVYFWDHENEPDDDWVGSFATAGNIELLANSFTDFVAGVRDTEDD
jgi:SMI1 / KNR4 family (SUKH-1)